MPSEHPQQWGRVLWRRRWLIVSMVLVTVAGVAYGLHTTSAAYQSHDRIQITAPQDANVAPVDPTDPSTSTLRDDLTLVQNDFATVAASTEVRSRTVQALHLAGRDAGYRVSVVPITDSNFVDLQVSAGSPALSQAIADTHASLAIKYYGELRAKPAMATMQAIGAQLQSAKAALDAASSGQSAASSSAAATQATASYAQLLSKYSQAALVASVATQVTYIQVVEPAATGQRPSTLRRLLPAVGLSVLGSLGLGLLVAFGLNELSRPAARSASAPQAARSVRGRVPLSERPHAGWSQGRLAAGSETQTRTTPQPITENSAHQLVSDACTKPSVPQLATIGPVVVLSDFQGERAVPPAATGSADAASFNDLEHAMSRLRNLLGKSDEQWLRG